MQDDLRASLYVLADSLSPSICTPLIAFDLNMCGLRCDLSFDVSLVTGGMLSIADWQECLLVQDDVTKVERLLNDGAESRKSKVDESTVRRGGGHLCPWELYAYIDGTSKAFG